MKKIFLPALSIVLLLLNFCVYSQTSTYTYTGATQTYTVPAGVTTITVDARGAMGGGQYCMYTNYQSLGGCGGRVQATVNVTPGHVLDIYVGQKPGNTMAAAAARAYGGGGKDAAWTTTWPGAGGGGGTSIIDVTGADTLVVAGGGGGGGGDFCPGYSTGSLGDVGGAGGGLTGGAGNSDACGTVGSGGQGGTPTAGGAGGATCDAGSGAAGTFYFGGNYPTADDLGAGGGGGGWFGGGSGGEGSGGGGGSSYTNPTYTIDVIHTQGYNCNGTWTYGGVTDTGNGAVIITVACSAGTVTPTSAGVCVGSTTSLTDATTGGTWSSGSTTIATVGSTGIVNGIGAGTSTISYSVSGGCVATAIITVHALPATITGTMNVCVGLTTALTDATTGGTWTSSNTDVSVGATGIVTGGTAGTSTITFKITSTGCYTVTTVTVNPLPAVITGTMSVCVGSTTALTDATSGGTWSSSSTIIATVGSTGIVSGGSAGTTIITYKLPTGCIETAIVTVNTQPATITGNTGPICALSTLDLSDATSSGTWSSSTITIGTVSTTGGVTGVNPGGTTTITYSIGSCSVTTTVTVNTQPVAITGNTGPICATSTLDLTDATGGGTWSSSNTSVGNVSTTGIVTGFNPGGTTTITYTIGSCFVTTIVTVTTQPVAITGNTGPICALSTLDLSDATSGGMWSSSATTVATVSATGVVTGVNPGGTAIITYSIGSCYVTTVVTVNVQPVAITGNTGPICATSTLDLTDATGGGTWSSSNTSVGTVSTTGIVTGFNPGGTTTITYTIGSCSVTTIVTVSTQPVTITGNTGPICALSTLDLSDATSGGTWSSSATIVATVLATGVVTGVNPGGTATITYTIGSCYVTTVVTVNVQPTAILGAFAICKDFTTTLTDATAGGTWSSSNTNATIVGSTGVVTGANVGTAIITYTIGSCYVTQEVTVNTEPTAILGNLSVCDSSVTCLSDATGGGTWSSVSTGIGTISTTGCVTGLAVGETTISYAIGSCAVTAVVTVNIQPTAILGTFGICKSSTTTLTDATGGGAWNSNNGNATIVVGSGLMTGANVGTSVITYTIGSCYVTQEVTVNTEPVAITGNTGPICQTFTLALTDATVGGLWSSVTTAVGTIGSVTGVVTGIGVGTTIISYTIGTCAVTTIVTVDLQPATISGTLSVCQGLTTSLSDATGGGTWSSTAISTGSISTTGIVTGISPGTTTISYTIGICAATAVVTVEPLPENITGTKTVCAGLNTNLFDGTGSGTWSSSNTSIATVGLTTGVVTGVSTVLTTSTATITYTVGSGCYITTIVTVNPLPTAILGANAVCLYSTITLSDAGGGTWSSANSSIASVGSTTGVVTGNTVGSTTITYTLPTGCIITTSVTVDPLPTPITGPNTVCPFNSITLNDGTSGGSWNSGNTAIATVVATTGVVTGVSAGTVNITYTTGSTGCSVSYTITVNPAPVPVITPVGDTIFCPGGFVALTANTGAGLTYQWYIGGVAISGAISSSYIVTLAGSYQVFETNSFGCSTFSIPMSVTIDTPVATITGSGDTTVCSGTSVTLDANTGAGLSYQWLLGGAFITGAVGNTYTTTTGGDYSVIVTNSIGCSATSDIFTITLLPTPLANVTLSGPLTFCQGDSVVMTTGFGAGYTYQWYNGAGAISGSSSLSYTATTSGTYSVIVTNSYSCTATSDAEIVSVNPLPDVAITASGPTIFCTGGSVTLIATAVAGDTYQWYVGGSLITGATNSSYLVTTVSGDYQVQITDPTTGCTAITSPGTGVTVVATPIIIPITPAAFCWGSSALLSTSVSGATGTVGYQWYFDGLIIAGATNATYNATDSGSYSCEITIPGSCTATTLGVPVIEYPLPNPIVTFDGMNFHTGSFYVTYQWYKNLVAIAGATTSSTPCTGPGDYKVAVTDTNGCQSYSDVYICTGCESTTYIPNVNKGNIKIYPNPAQTMVHIESAELVRAVISGIDGRTLLNIAAAKDIDISNLADGIYMIMLYDANGIMVKAEKLVKTTE